MYSERDHDRKPDALTRISLHDARLESEKHSAIFEAEFVFASPEGSLLPKPVVGFYVSLDMDSEYGRSLDLGVLIAALRGYHPELPFICVNFRFSNFEQLKMRVLEHPLVGVNSQSDRILYVLICKRSNATETFPEIHVAKDSASEDGDYLRIDPVTLEPIGTPQIKLRFSSNSQ